MFHMHDYDRFLDIQFAKYRDWPWKVCFWHRVATEFQPVSRVGMVNAVDPC